MTAKEASQSVNKTLFDYSDLTAFEQDVMKRIIPYYTWLRKNSQLQVEMLLENPKKYQYVTKLQGGIESMVDDEDLMDDQYVNDFALDWIQLPMTVTNPQGRQERVLINPNLPFMDLGRIPNPLKPIDSAMKLFTQSNPILKVPVEQVFNKNVYFDSPIVNKDESQIINRTDHVLGNLAPYTAVKGLATKNGIDLGLQSLNTVSGIKLLSYDYDAYKRMIQSGVYENDTPTIFEKKIKKAVSNVIEGISDGFKAGWSTATEGVANIVNKSKPLDASEYIGSLRPISKAKYDAMSDEDKKQYSPPNTLHAMALNKKAESISQKEIGEANTGKKLVWAFFEQVGLGERNKPYEFGNVIQVVDGDTFKMNVNGQEKTVRMLLIDTPEIVKAGVIEQPVGKVASEHTKQFLIGQDAKIIFDKSHKDIYGRTLGYVEVNGVDLQKELIKQGLAQTGYLYEKPYRRYKDYTNAETKAYNEKKGIWQVPDYALPNDDTGYKTHYDKNKVDAINRAIKW